MPDDVIDVVPKGEEQAQALKSVGWLSYVLHLIVAVGAIVPGAQAGALLLVVRSPTSPRRWVSPAPRRVAGGGAG